MHAITCKFSPILLKFSENVITKQLYPVLTNSGTNLESFQLELWEKIRLNVRIKTMGQLEHESEKIIVDIS